MGVFRGKEEKKGANFAGLFILIKWISDSPSLRIAIVDAITGEVFAPPDTTSLYRLQSLTYPGDTQKNAEVQFRLDSNLLIIKNNSGVCPYISYYLLKENRWELLKKEPLQRTEFPYFKMAN